MSNDRHIRFSRLNLLVVLCLVAVAAVPLVVDVTKLDAG